MARVRSPNYPLIGLKESLDKASSVHKAEGQNPVPREALAKLMGFGGLNGRSDKVISAVSKYGLLEKVKDGDLRISDLAVQILFPVDEDEKTAAIKKAATQPTLFADILENWSSGPLPSDESLKVYLVRRGFNQNALEPVISSFRDTMALVDMNHTVVESPSKADEYGESEMQEHVNSPTNPPAEKMHVQKPAFVVSNPVQPGKPIMFDMETVSGSYSFDNADDLQEFIDKLEKIKGLMPTKH